MNGGNGGNGAMRGTAVNEILDAIAGERGGAA